MFRTLRSQLSLWASSTAQVPTPWQASFLPPTVGRRWFSADEHELAQLRYDPSPVLILQTLIDYDRKWKASFNPEIIPRDKCEIRFDRSSGPGGQNVNKLNTKATVRLELRKASFLPKQVIEAIKTSHSTKQYLTSDNELVIQSQASRTQAANLEDAYRKLYDIIRECVEIPGETSQEQKDKVKNLARRDNERRLKEKKRFSDKKSSRRSKGDDY
ncbi:hypothetical protein SAICODRAFT_50983 [Saitoella complicata NRRL Y-17804]|uniref:uncharacterized protein n=1 Tax=Saitoella complicata (strain BCRC 22490 / CBS 7301 / JCM 7358 / NBRC 10748 / NRRL Y-17804) TaxID=698492 RepID=UPI00086699AF|nr:uncharacterized protein SAICODRAFT_50983 [Saitoella complicata NRRL Y-17804]ODQ56591.1 hypothetical protein SAICODRAFT_50983 [Saitoella complicata NRRL Y-17804]